MKVLTAKDIMTRNLLEAKGHWSLSRLAEFFVEHSISGAPVTSEEGELIGVVSLTDLIVHDTLPQNDSQSHLPHEYYLHGLERRYAIEELSSFQVQEEPVVTVDAIMTPTIFKVDEDATVQEVAAAMIKNRIHRVFVAHQEKLVGIITSVDMLKVIRDM